MSTDNHGDDKTNAWTCNRVSRALLIIVNVVFTLAGVVMLMYAGAAPDWWTVAISEYGQVCYEARV
jgi:hypothetical protein